MIHLSAEKKQKLRFIVFIAFISIIGITVLVLALTQQPPPRKVVERKETQLGGETAVLLKKSKEGDLKAELAKKNIEIQSLQSKEEEQPKTNDPQPQKSVPALPKHKEEKAGPVNSTTREINIEREPLPSIPLVVAQAQNGNLNLPFPTPPGQKQRNQPGNMPAPVPGGNNDKVHTEKPQGKVPIGGYLDAEAPKETKEEAAAKKKSRTVYMPSGTFMKANLLTGVLAPTAKVGNFSSSPTLMRVQAPAQLPNDVKENVAGCFVTGSATGILATRSATMTTAFFSCVAKDKSWVIDQKIRGYVADNTGAPGVKGNVVADLDKTLGYAAIAGALSGVGEVLKATSVTSNISAIGQTQTLDSSKVGQAALGGSLTKTTDELQKFYMMLVQQQVPVIEIGADIPVTVVFEEGVEFVIKNLCEGEICD